MIFQAIKERKGSLTSIRQLAPKVVMVLGNNYSCIYEYVLICCLPIPLVECGKVRSKPLIDLHVFSSMVYPCYIYIYF